MKPKDCPYRKTKWKETREIRKEFFRTPKPKCMIKGFVTPCEPERCDYIK